MKPKHKAKNKSYARYRWREKHKKQYTFTKTKFVVGFLISLFSSVFLGSYFDKYGGVVVSQSMDALREAWKDDATPKHTAQTPDSATAEKADARAKLNEQPQIEDEADIEAIEERAKAVQVSPSTTLKTITRRPLEIRSSETRSENSFPNDQRNLGTSTTSFGTAEFEAINFDKKTN